MSTPSPTLSPTISWNNPDTVGAPDDEGGGMQRGASYFFGFLITFVVLLLIFVGCGVLSRRRFTARRRARFEWDMEPWAERLQGGDVGYVPPVLMEKGFVRAKDGSSWRGLVPLAALVISPHRGTSKPDICSDISPLPATQFQNTYSLPSYHGQDMDSNLAVISRTLSSASHRRSESLTRRNSGLVRVTSPTPYHRNPNVILADHEDVAEEGHQQQEQERGNREAVSQQHGSGCLHYLNPASWFRSLCRRRRERGQGEDTEITHSTTDDEKQEEKRIEEKEKVLQVAVLIEMPSPPTSSFSEGGEQMPEYEIGVASLSWIET